MPRASNYQLINSPSSPPLLSHFLHHRFTDFSLLFDPPSFFAPLPSLSRSLRTGSSLIYVGHVYSLAGTWPRRIEKERSDRRDNPFEIIYRIERRPTLLPLVSIIVSRRFIDAPRKRLLPESRLLPIRSLKAIPSRIRGKRGGRKAIDRSAKFISEKFDPKLSKELRERNV